MCLKPSGCQHGLCKGYVGSLVISMHIYATILSGFDVTFTRVTTRSLMVAYVHTTRRHTQTHHRLVGFDTTFAGLHQDPRRQLFICHLRLLGFQSGLCGATLDPPAKITRRLHRQDKHSHHISIAHEAGIFSFPINAHLSLARTLRHEIRKRATACQCSLVPSPFIQALIADSSLSVSACP